VDPTAPFLPGLQLCERFYHDAVAPILERHFPRLRYGAGRLGTGSDVLGFDTARSMDHDWGPQAELYLRDADYSDDLAADIRRVMADDLPFEIAGYPTHVATPEVHGGFLTATSQRPISHKVHVSSARRFFGRYLGVDPLDAAGLSAAAWLAIPEQHLRTVTVGGVFRDDLGELARAREVLRWYPHDVWLYLLAAEWRRIEQEEPFMARCADVGDELGSRVVAARLAREVMHLCFLMERQYAPYSKWFGTAFSRLACAPRVGQVLNAALAADDWHVRERHLSTAYTLVAEMHNALEITESIPPHISAFYDRPYQVIHGDRFWQAIVTRITDQGVRDLPRLAGSTSQWVDSTDVQIYTNWFPRLRALYENA